MSDFLTRLAQRQLGELTLIRPSLPPLFGARGGDPHPPVREEHETETRVELGSNAQTSGIMGMREAPGSPSLVGLSRESAQRERGGNEPRIQASTERELAVPAPLVPPAKPHAPPQDGHESVRAREAPMTAAERPAAKASAPMSLVRDQPRGEKTSSRREGAAKVATEDDAARRLDSPPAGAAVDRISPKREAIDPPRLVERHDERSPSMTAPERIERSPEHRRDRPGIAPHDAPALATDESVVQVTIGRIEVTAATATSTPKRATPARKPPMSLGDYLAQRQRGER